MARRTRHAAAVPYRSTACCSSASSPTPNGLPPVAGLAAAEHVLDLSPAFRNLTNGRSTPEGKGLIGLLRYYGLDAIDAKRKDAMRQRIMQGWPFTPEEREQILKYCMSDVDSLRARSAANSARHRASRRRALSRRIRRRVCTDGAPRRSDRHGSFPAARRSWNTATSDVDRLVPFAAAHIGGD